MTDFISLQARFARKIRGIIFDCDGVMVDSRAANISYYNMLLRELGKPPLTPAQEDYAQMATSRQAVEQVMTPEELARLPEITRRLPYNAVVLPLLVPEEGFIPLVRWLHERKVLLAVHTNRREKGIWDVLDKLDIRSCFDAVMNAECVAPKPSPEGIERILDKWHLAPDQVFFVGDSETDRGAASAGKVPLVAYRNKTLPADWHVDSFSDFQKAIDPFLDLPSGENTDVQTSRP